MLPVKLRTDRPPEREMKLHVANRKNQVSLKIERSQELQESSFLSRARKVMVKVTRDKLIVRS